MDLYDEFPKGLIEGPQEPVSEPLWSVKRDGRTFSCALCYRGKSYGVEAQILSEWRAVDRATVRHERVSRPVGEPGAGQQHGAANVVLNVAVDEGNPSPITIVLNWAAALKK
jgi:hypothetical protein